MARAMLLFERQADASWLPTTVILATPERLQGRCLPGDENRDARLASILSDALPPRKPHSEERATFEDWIGGAVNALANGHTTWATEVVPTATVEALYEREVADVVSRLPPASQAIEADPVGEESGIELVEITDGGPARRRRPRPRP